MRLNITFEPDAWQDLLAAIEACQHRARALVPMGLEAYFQQKARFLSAYSSVRLEESRTSEATALQALVEGHVHGPSSEVAISNVSEAGELVAQLAADWSTRTDSGLVRALNAAVLKGLSGPGAGRRGRWRTGPAQITDSRTRQALYRPPPHYWVPDLMDDLMSAIQEWQEARVPGAIVAGLAHLGLVSIHPFEDGNGRTARLLAELVLDQSDWSANGMVSLSRAVAAQRQEYHTALRAAHGPEFAGNVDGRHFLRFHVEALLLASISLESHAANFKRRAEKWKEITAGRLSDRQSIGFLVLMDIGVPLSAGGYAALARITPSSAIADLADMVRRGYVERMGAGNAARYRVSTELALVLRDAGEAGDDRAAPASGWEP